MTRTAIVLVFAALAGGVLADDFPVTGKWGVDTSSDNGPFDCSNRRVMTFDGDRRLDSASGFPDSRNFSMSYSGPSRYDIVDDVFNGPQRGRITYTLQLVDADRIEIKFPKGGPIKLRRCE